MGITSVALYSDEDGVVDDLLEDLRTLPLVELMPISGTQMHFAYEMENGGVVIVKPQRSVNWSCRLLITK